MVLHVEDHPTFRRDGENLYSHLEVGIVQAALGAEVEVETMDGHERVTVPRGTQTGDLVTLKGKGIPHLRRGGRGNHYVELQVVMPKRLSKKQEELLRAFAEESGESVRPSGEGFFKRIRR